MRKLLNVIGTVATPSILLKDAGGRTITGGTINIGGGTISTAAAGNGNGVLISSALSAPGGLTIAANGDTSETGGGVGGNLSLSGANTISGDVTITSGVVVSTSNFGGAANKIILDGGGIVDTGANTQLANPLEVPTGKTGVYRTYGGVATAQITGPVTGGGTLMRSDGGTMTVNGDFSAFGGTLMNARGTMIIGATAATTLAAVPVVQTDGGNILRLGAAGDTSIKSLVSDRDVIVPFGSRLNIVNGTYTTVGAGTEYNGFWAQGTTAGNAAATGEITSSSGTLTITNGGATGTLTGTDNRIRLKIVDFGSGPNPTLAVVKNNDNQLIFDMVNTYSGGTTLNGGRLQADNLAAFGTGTVTVNSGGQAWLTLNGSYPNDFVINGTGVTEGAGNLGAIRFNTATLSGDIAVASAASIVAYGATGTHTGALTGTAPLSLNLAASPGTLNFLGDNSGYTGTMTLNAGTLNLGAGSFGGDLVVSAGTATVNGDLAGDATVNGGRLNVNGSTASIVTVADGAALGGEGTITGTLNLGATTGADLHINATTADALHVAELNLAGGNTVFLDAMPIAAGEFTVLSYDNLASGDEFNFVVPQGIYRGDPEVQHDIANSRFTLELDSQERTWTNAALTGTWNTTDLNWNEGDNLFFSGDQVIFTDTAAGTVNLATDLQPLSITLQNTAGNNYAFTGGSIIGATGLTMTGGGNLTLGGANTFSGPISVQAGVLSLSTATALGQTSEITVAAGAQADLAGQGVGNNTNTTWTIAGDGGGLGAVTNSGGAVYEDSSIYNLVLAADAKIGGNNGRFDVGRNGISGTGGSINGAGFTLTKVGSNAMVFRGPASNITYVIDAGMLTFEDYDSASGTNPITVNNAGSTTGSYGARTLPNDVILNDGTRLISQAGNGIWTGGITANGTAVTFQADGNLIIDGTLAGTANITKPGGGTLVLQNTAAGYSGKFTVTAGALRVENNAALGTATGADALTIGGATLQSGTITALASATVGSPTQGITQTGNVTYDAGAGNTLTINGAITGTGNLVKANNTSSLILNQPVTLNGLMNANNGVIQFNQGLNITGSFQTGTDLVATIAGTGGSIGTSETDATGGIRMWRSTLNINHTGTLNVWDIQVQEGTGQRATVNHSSGTINVTRDMRVGHWGNADATQFSVYNMTGGVINQPDTVTNPTDEAQANLMLGIDGTGVLNQSGGVINTSSMVLDNRGDTAGNDTYRMTGGRLNMGKWGIRSGNTGTTKLIELGGGIVGASADWSTALPITLTGMNGNVTVDTLDSVDATTPRAITLSGNLSGTGGLTKTGAGSLTLSGTGSFTGTALVNGGALYVVGNAAATGTLRTATGGSLHAGTLTTPGTATTTNLTFDGGSADFRIGASTDKLTATGALNVESPTAIRAIPSNAISGPFPQTFDVIDYTGTVGGTSGFAGLSFASSNPHLAGTLINDTDNTVIKVQINSADSVVWKGNVNGNWDVNATSNWVLGSDGLTPTKYYDFDVVKFDDAGITTPAVTLSGTITPAALSVENTTGTYVFSGSGIGGGTGLAKSGAGGLMLLGNNTYTGTVNITGGRVDVGNGGATGTLGGTGGITLEPGATLAFNTTTNHLLPASRPVNGGGAMEKAGSGTLEFQGTHGFSGGLTINGGTVLLSSGGGVTGIVSGMVTVNSGGTLSASAGNAFGYGGQRIHTLNLNGGTATTSAAGDQGWNIAINLTDGATLASTGGGYYSLGGPAGGTGSAVSYLGTTAPATVSATIRLRENNPGNLLPFFVNDGAAPVDLIVSGAITQAAAGYGIAKTGPGTLELSGANTFSGPLDIAGGTVRINRPTHSVVPNALTGTGGTLEHASPQDLVLSGDGSNFGGTIDANAKMVHLVHETAGSGTGGTLALEGGTLALGLNLEGLLYYGTFAGAAMNTTPLATSVFADNTAGLHGAIGGDTTIAYDGEIYLTAGDWSFGENVDDAVYVNINSQTILNNNGWDTITSGTFNAPADGWYPITLRVQNGGGGNGPVGDWATAGIGIGIKQGGTSTNVADYQKFDIGVLGTNCRVFKAAGTHTMAGSLALGGGKDNTINTSDGSLALNGAVTGGAADRLVKIGSGTLSLNAINTYSGDTVVNEGVVAVNGSSIRDTNKVVMDGGMLDLTNTERVTALFFGEAQQPDGTYGATGSGATTIDDTRFSGTGVLVVGTPTGYAGWAAINAPSGGPNDDEDGDGVTNAVEYVLGGGKDTNDLGKLPTVDASGGDLVFTFVRDQDSKTDDTTVEIEVGATLAAWPFVYTVGISPEVAVTDNGDGTETVTLTIAKGTDPVKFARLAVTIN